MLWGATAIASATDYPYMVIRQKDGTETVMKSEGLAFSISGTQLSATNADGTTAFTFADLASMEFSKTASIASAIADDGNCTIDVYTPAGQFIGSYATIADALDGVPVSGVYVMKSKNGTAKLVVQK